MAYVKGVNATGMIATPSMVRYCRVMRWDVLLTVLLVLLVGTLGVWHALSMNGAMSRCPLMTDAASLCGMNPFEHISLWQRLFTAVPHRAFMLMMLGIVVLGVALGRFRGSRVLARADQMQARYQSHRRLVLAFASLEPLKRAFSQGILHPKICG